MPAALGIVGLSIFAAFLVTTPPASRRQATRRTQTVAERGQGPNAFANLPITFVENRGQTNQEVRYFARGPHYAFFLTPNEVVLSLEKPSAGATRENASYSKPGAEGSSTAGIALALQFLGANPAVTLHGAERAPGEVNYISGSNPAAWHTGLSSYMAVVYRDLWAGVDLELREKDGALKYEFHVRPHARIEDIRLAYRGADSITLDSRGGLSIQTRLGTIHDAEPVTFQEIDGVRRTVESHYVLEAGDHSYGFRIGTGYRPDQELIIDPGVEYSTFLGGTSHEIANGIAVDGSGNSYLVGFTQSPDYPTTAGAFDRTGATNNFSDVFVAKLNPAGTALVYSTFIGGSDLDFGRAIAVDASGNAYIAGQTKSSNFPTTSNAFDRTFNVLNCPRCGVDNYDAFVAKLNANGSALVYSTFLGGATDIDDALGIAVDAGGNAYVTGETGSSDFPVTAGAFRTTRNGAYDAFVTKLNPSGSGLVYSTFIGGGDVDFGVRIKVDASNSAYVVGNTRSSDFPVTAGAFDTSLNGGFDIFLLKLNAAGSNLTYSTFLGGLDMESAGGLAIDSTGNAYVSGGTASANFPTTAGVFQPASTGGGGFVTKINSTGSALIYSTYLGDAGSGCSAIALTPGGNVWLTGATSSQSFPTTPDAFQGFYHAGGSVAGSADAFVTELNATGSAILYSTYLGGINPDYGTDLGLDLSGNVYVTGETMSPDFPTTPGAFDRVFGGRIDIFWGDAFITKLSATGTPPPPPPLPTVAAVTTGLEVVGGNSTTVTVALTTGAQGNGAVVSLTSSNPAALSLPATLTIPTGTLSGSVVAATSSVSANTPVTITASYNNSSKAAAVTVLPTPPPATLSSLGLFPNAVTGGDSTLAILAVTSPAPAGGFVATLSSNNPIATVPPSVTVPAGETNVSFSIPTAVVTTSTGMTISATAGGQTRLAPLTVNPAAPPVTTATLSVTATGRNGERVTSSPAGISAATGSSMQAPFPSGTSITLAVSNGRDAIWSGACSSGGSKRKTCTFTLNGTATVTANVQ